MSGTGRGKKRATIIVGGAWGIELCSGELSCAQSKSPNQHGVKNRFGLV